MGKLRQRATSLTMSRHILMNFTFLHFNVKLFAVPDFNSSHTSESEKMH